MPRHLYLKLLWSAAFFLPFTSFAEEVSTADLPALIRANEIHYDAAGHTVTATGNVEITKEGRILMADSIFYDQNSGMVKATGNVSVMERDGSVFFADKAELQDDMQKGVVDAFKARFPDNSLVAANSAEKPNSAITKLRRITYSPCTLCSDKNPSDKSAPLWQIRADKMKIDEDEQKISYKDAYFDLYGTPIFYTPYFSHPTPTAPQKSGFLVPTYSSITTLGPTVRIPYYINFNSDFDATITPIFTTEEGVVMSGEVRNQLKNGYYQLSGSITDPEKLDAAGNKIPGHEIRGHIEGYGNFALPNDWAWGFAGKRASDDTYLQRYKFGNEDKLTSRAYLEKLEDRDYVTLETVSFQELSLNPTPGSTPLVLPFGQAHFESDPGYNGSRYIADVSTVDIYRTTGVRSRRFTTTGLWHIPFITDNGHIFEFSTHLRGDVYSTDNVQTPTSTGSEDGIVGRLIPEAELQWHYPLVNELKNSKIFIEPETSFIVSPNGGNPSNIPNEDSQEIDLSDINILDANRFSGYDRVEEGPRFNYALKGGLYGDNRGNINFLVGQNYRFQRDFRYPDESGIATYLSDYVGRIMLTDEKLFDISYKFRLAQNNFAANRNEIGTGINLMPLKLDINYITVKRDPTSEDFITLFNGRDGEAVFTSASLVLNEQWALTGSARRDLSEDGGWISTGIGAFFKNECLTITSLINKDYIEDRDIKPATTVTVQVSLKNLN